MAEMQVDREGWSGDGDFTIQLLGWLERVEEVARLRVEDAPASRSGAGYVLVENEIFVTFATGRRRVPTRWLGFIPRTRSIEAPRLTLAGLESRLAADADIGPADYADDEMLQYMRTERVVQPYQTRGYKLVELVRLYEVKDFRASSRD
jgi:hypothetical protein